MYLKLLTRPWLALILSAPWQPYTNENKILAALERTYLGYLRTSAALTTFSVVVAQLFRLQSQSAAADNFGSYILGIPLAVISAGMAICVTLLGAVRFYRQQHAMSRGKIHVGGWDLNVVGCGTLTVRWVHILIGKSVSNWVRWFWWFSSWS